MFIFKSSYNYSYYPLFPYYFCKELFLYKKTKEFKNNELFYIS